MVCVADGVDGEVVDDTARGHVGVSLRVNVWVTFPRFPGPELCRPTHKRMRRVSQGQLGTRIYIGNQIWGGRGNVD